VRHPEEGRKLELVSLTLIALAVLCLALMTTFYIVDLMFAVLAVMSSLFLFGGLILGYMIHKPNVKDMFNVNYNTFIWGALGVALVAIVQMPLLFLRMSIYNLSVLDSLGVRLFLVSQAVAEECLFAYFLYSFLKKVSFPVLANFSCAVIFMLMHAAAFSNQIPVLIVVSISRIILNVIYDLGDLGSSTLAHVVVNLAAGG